VTDRGAWCENFARDVTQPVKDWTDAHLDIARVGLDEAAERAIADLELPGCRPPLRRPEQEQAADAKVIVRAAIGMRLHELDARP